MGAIQTAWRPRRDTKTLLSLSPSKSVLVSRPLAGLFSILHARALLRPRSAPNCKQTGIRLGGEFNFNKPSEKSILFGRISPLFI